MEVPSVRRSVASHQQRARTSRSSNTRPMSASSLYGYRSSSTKPMACEQERSDNDDDPRSLSPSGQRVHDPQVLESGALISSTSLMLLPHYTDMPIAQYRCWDHGCAGRLFSTMGNLQRHVREKAASPQFYCPVCSASFTRRSAIKRHLEKANC